MSLLEEPEHTDSQGSACCSGFIVCTSSGHPCLFIPAQYLSIFSSPVVCVFLFGYFFGNRHSPRNQIIIICPRKFSPASLNLSSTRGRLLTVFLLTGMVLNTKERYFSNLQQWKSEVISLKLMEWVYLPLGKRRWNLGLCVSGELNLSQEADTKCTVIPLWLFHLMFFSVVFLSLGIPTSSVLTVCSSDTILTFFVEGVAGVGIGNMTTFKNLL